MLQVEVVNCFVDHGVDWHLDGEILLRLMDWRVEFTLRKGQLLRWRLTC